MTSKTMKTILFASLIAAMILPFSGMQVAQAEELDKNDVERIANKATTLMEKLETEQNPKKIKRMQAQLDKHLAVLNSVGLYTEKQFEVVKAERLTEQAPEEKSGAQAFCPSCSDPAVKIRSGFDYKLWGFYGTAHGQWDTITNADKNGFSQAIVGSWGADYMHVFYQYYLANGASSGTAKYSPYITNSNDGLVKNYGTFTKTTTTTSITTDYPSTIAYTPVNGGDKAKLVVVLQSIS